MKRYMIILIIMALLNINLINPNVINSTNNYVSLEIPYICQTQDLPANTMGLGDPEYNNTKYGYYACGPTSTTMVLAYYNLLPPEKNDYQKMVPSSFSSYGYYVAPADPFTTSKMTYDKSRFVYSASYNKIPVYGVWGQTQSSGQEQNGSQYYGSVRIYIEQLLQRNGLSTEVVQNNNVETETFKATIKNAIDNKYAIIWHVTNHYLVCRGYYDNNDEFYYIVNDPYPKNNQRQEKVQKKFHEIPNTNQANDYVIIVKGQVDEDGFTCDKLNISPNMVHADLNKFSSLNLTTNFKVDRISGTFYDPLGNSFSSIALTETSQNNWQVNFNFNTIGYWRLNLDIEINGKLCNRQITIDVNDEYECSNCSFNFVSQYENDCTSPIPAGGNSKSSTVCLKATAINCPDGFQVQFAVANVNDVNYQNPILESTTTSSQEKTVYLSNLTNGSYHWKARIVKSDSSPCSDWSYYGNNSEIAVDFTIGDSNSCDIDITSIPNPMNCNTDGKFVALCSGYDPYTCSVTVTNDRNDLVYSSIDNSIFINGKFYIILKTYDKEGIANVSIKINGAITCSKTILLNIRCTDKPNPCKNNFRIKDIPDCIAINSSIQMTCIDDSGPINGSNTIWHISGEDKDCTIDTNTGILKTGNIQGKITIKAYYFVNQIESCFDYSDVTICGTDTDLFVDPQLMYLCVGERKQFYIKSTNGISFTDANWSSDSQCLTQVPGSPGLFEAICTGGPFKIKATVMTNAGLKEVKPATVTIVNNPIVTISPTNLTLDCNQNTQFTAITNPPGIPVTWSVEPSTIGSITSSGLFTPVQNIGDVSVSGTILAKAGTGICIGEGRAYVNIQCKQLFIEPINSEKLCQPFQLKAFLEPGHTPCNPIWEISCQPSNIGTIDSTTGWFTPYANAKGTCTVNAYYGSLKASLSTTIDCSQPPPPECINLWIPKPTPLMQPSNPNLSAFEICKCIPYQFKAYCTKSDNTGPHDVSSQGQWSISNPVAGVNIDSSGKLISAVVGTYTVVFKMGGLTAQYTVTVVDCYICPPIGMYIDCDLVFFVGRLFPINPILYTADGSTSQLPQGKTATYKISDPSVLKQNGNEFIGMKAGRTTVDIYYENLHTKTVVIINPPQNNNCSSGSIIAPPSSQVLLDPLIRPLPSYWYYKCCPIVFKAIFKDVYGKPIDCSVSRWDAIALDQSNDGTFIMNNGSFVANRSGWYIIIVNCCELTLVICIFIVDVFCLPTEPDCEFTLDKYEIRKDFSDKCCPDGNTNNNIPLDSFEELIKVTKNNDKSVVTIDSNAYWLKTEPTSFTDKYKEVKVIIDPRYFAKGSGGTCKLTFKCDNGFIRELFVTIKTKAEIYATAQAFQLKQDVLQSTPTVIKKELTDAEILQQLNLAPSSYRIASSCDSSFDMKQKYGVIPFQTWLNKGTVPNGYEGNRTFLPLKFFADLGCLNVSWDNNKKEATLEGYGKKIIIGLKEVYSYVIELNGEQPTPEPQEPINVEGLVRIINGRVMVGAKFVFDAFGASIVLKQDKRTVDIVFKPGWDYTCCISSMPILLNSALNDLIFSTKYIFVVC